MTPERALPVHKSKRGDASECQGKMARSARGAGTSRRTSSDTGKPLIFTPIRESSAES